MKVTETLRMYRYPRTVQFRLYSIGWDHTTRSFLSGEVVIGPNRLCLVTSFKVKGADVASLASLASQTLSCYLIRTRNECLTDKYATIQPRH